MRYFAIFVYLMVGLGAAAGDPDPINHNGAIGRLIAYTFIWPAVFGTRIGMGCVCRISMGCVCRNKDKGSSK